MAADPLPRVVSDPGNAKIRLGYSGTLELRRATAQTLIAFQSDPHGLTYAEVATVNKWLWQWRQQRQWTRARKRSGGANDG